MPTTLNREQVIEKVCRLAAEQGAVNPAEVTPETHLFSDLNFDSLDATEFAMSMEDEFGVSISDERAAAVKTVGQAIELLMNLNATEEAPIRPSAAPGSR